jgi:N-acetylglutamate synthase-like GNAT family acetyltransferase
MTVVIRVAQPEDFERVGAFYHLNGYDSPIHPEDMVVLAEDRNQLCGAVRLLAEEDVLVLRGMRVAEPFQRQGIGTKMLEAVGRLLGNRECYCIPYPYLRDFYSQIGFQEIEPSFAPDFLANRLALYRQQLGLNVMIMRRAGEAATHFGSSGMDS